MSSNAYYTLWHAQFEGGKRFVLLNCSIVYWSLRRESMRSTTQVLQKYWERKPKPLWHLFKRTRSCSYWQNPLVSLVLWSLHQLWRKTSSKTDRKTWAASQNNTYSDLQCSVSPIARLCTSWLGMQSPLLVQRWTILWDAFFKPKGLPTYMFLVQSKCFVKFHQYSAFCFWVPLIWNISRTLCRIWYIVTSVLFLLLSLGWFVIWPLNIETQLIHRMTLLVLQFLSMGSFSWVH